MDRERARERERVRALAFVFYRCKRESEHMWRRLYTGNQLTDKNHCANAERHSCQHLNCLVVSDESTLSCDSVAAMSPIPELAKTRTGGTYIYICRHIYTLRYM